MSRSRVLSTGASSLNFGEANFTPKRDGGNHTSLEGQPYPSTPRGDSFQCKAVLKARGFNPPLRSAHSSDDQNQTENSDCSDTATPILRRTSLTSSKSVSSQATARNKRMSGMRLIWRLLEPCRFVWGFLEPRHSQQSRLS